MKQHGFAFNESFSRCIRYNSSNSSKSKQVPNWFKFFDSWVGALNVGDYRRYIKPHMIRLISEVKEKHDVPVILFGVGASHFNQ